MHTNVSVDANRCGVWGIGQKHSVYMCRYIGRFLLHMREHEGMAGMQQVANTPFNCEQLSRNTSLKDKLNLSRSQNKVCSHAYNACFQLSRSHRMYHFQYMDIVYRETRLFSSKFLSVTRLN